LATSLAGCWRIEPTQPGPDDPAQQPPAEATVAISRNLALGSPSAAPPDQSDPNDYLLDRPEFAISYNKSRGGPNWVSWQVRKSDLGPVERSNEFHPEPDIPSSWRITPNDYTGSGYDRGHVCPSGDRTATKTANLATLSMANMLPQAAALNRGPWGDLENYCRDLVKRGNDLYIVAGGYGTKGTIGKGRVAVPARFWKVILVCPAGTAVPRDVTAENAVIAVDFPNEENVELDWKRYATTIGAIEQASGVLLYNALTPAVRDALRTKGSALQLRDSRPSNAKGAQSEPAGSQVIGNRKSKIYHVPGCPGYDQVAKENRVKFASAAEAERAGYRRAANCP